MMFFFLLLVTSVRDIVIVWAILWVSQVVFWSSVIDLNDWALWLLLTWMTEPFDSVIDLNNWALRLCYWHERLSPPTLLLTWTTKPFDSATRKVKFRTDTDTQNLKNRLSYNFEIWYANYINIAYCIVCWCGVAQSTVIKYVTEETQGGWTLVVVVVCIEVEGPGASVLIVLIFTILSCSFSHSVRWSCYEPLCSTSSSLQKRGCHCFYITFDLCQRDPCQIL